MNFRPYVQCQFGRLQLGLLSFCLCLSSVALAGTVTRVFDNPQVVRIRLAKTDANDVYKGDDVDVKVVHTSQKARIIYRKDDLVDVKLASSSGVFQGMKVALKRSGPQSSKHAAAMYKKRHAKRAMVVDVKGGLVHDLRAGVGVDFFYHSSEQWEWGLSYMQSATYSDLDRISDDVRIGSTAQFQLVDVTKQEKFVSLIGRRYVNDTFYFAGGLGMREANATYSIKESQTVLEHDLRVQSYMLQGGIGQNYLFANGIKLGIEYLNGIIPISSSGYRKYRANSLLSADATQYEADIEDRIAEDAQKPNFQAAILTLGLSF